MSETERVIERYKRRATYGRQTPSSFEFGHFAKCERELLYFKILQKHFQDFDKKTLLEIGAGSGDNLLGFVRMGFSWKNLTANELLEDRGIILKSNAPCCDIHIGDANEMPYVKKFNIVFQSTVFTSLLDFEYKQKLAEKMWSLVSQDGLILWYDFIYNNPRNADVKGIRRQEIYKLFPKASKIDFYSATLAPPLGRRAGKLYPILNFLFPFLRTHVVAAVFP